MRAHPKLTAAAVVVLWLAAAGLVPFLRYAAHIHPPFGDFYVPVLLVGTLFECPFMAGWALAVWGRGRTAALFVLLATIMAVATIFVAAGAEHGGARFVAWRSSECAQRARLNSTIELCAEWSSGLQTPRAKDASASEFLLADGANLFSPFKSLQSPEARRAAYAWTLSARGITQDEDPVRPEAFRP